MRMDQEHEDTTLELESEPESPSVPPMDLFTPIGLDTWTFRDHGRKKLFPPPEMMQKLSEERSNPVLLECRFPRMTDDMARSALLSFVNSKCCYGNRAAGELLIQEMKPQTFYRYRLKTFNETRVCEWTFEPYTNASVDGPQNGVSPRPWDIKVQVPQMFQEDTKKFRVPHSSLLKECHKCHGRGRYKCSGCHGGGRMRCVTCNGARKAKAKHLKYQKRCQMCSGTGRKRCNTCSGRGNKNCSTCQGVKKLLHFIQLIITWKNNVYEFISEHQLSFPRDLLSKAMGENVLKDENTLAVGLSPELGKLVANVSLPFEETSSVNSKHTGDVSLNGDETFATKLPLSELKPAAQLPIRATTVYPLVDFPNAEISLASQRAIAEHHGPLTSTSRILRQRQTIELIPVTEVHYRYAAKSYIYYIYGTENKVYALDYPERYCCGCTII